MLKSLRILLFPFSLVYGLIVSLRNLAYDQGWFKTTEFSLPVINVGNLSVGGTGKTPMVEYLVRLLSENQNLAILSRGYGRKSKGFILADKYCSADLIGDEPYQYFRKFHEVQVVVDADRVHGVSELLKLKTKPELILLDDAFQHRSIKAGLSILMTSYNNLYVDDLLLPAGNLREPSSQAKRADLIVVSKCPIQITRAEMDSIRKRLSPKADKEVFFAGLTYADHCKGATESVSLKSLVNNKVVLVTGIANPKPLESFLKEQGIAFKHLAYRDHYDLSGRDMDTIQEELDKLPDNSKIVLTTEKDYVRSFIDSSLPVYYLPIRMTIIDMETRMNQIINDYVSKN